MAKFICNFISYTLRRAVDITVIVPSPTIPQATRRFKAENPCYHTPRERYPVVYLLHGMGNNHATWTGYTNVELYAEEHQIAIVNISAENKSYICKGEDDFFTFVSEELPDFVCGMFPISRRSEDTYIAGLSMGGYGTLVHGLNFPERFAALGAFSAGVTAMKIEMSKFDPDKLQAQHNAQGSDLPPLKPDPEMDSRFDPVALAMNMPGAGKSFPKIYMACGGADFLLHSNRQYRDMLIQLGADVTWDEIPGYGHEWRFWDIEIERFLDWLPRTDCYAREGKRKI